MHQQGFESIMSNYQRLFLDNYYVFITCVTFKRNPILIDNVKILRKGFAIAKEKYDFEIIAVVILEDHFHMIINPNNINDYPKIILSIKQYFSQNIDKNHLKKIEKHITESMRKRNESGTWQRRYYEHTIRNVEDLNTHIDYIHYNPIKHKLSESVNDWEFSSFNKYVKDGTYDVNWGSSSDVEKIIGLNIE